jgi:hypothetical protein
MSSTLDLWDPRFLRTAAFLVNRSTARPNRASQNLPSAFTKNSDLVLPRPGGADRVRTDDLRLARAALSQLSYSPFSGGPADQSARRYLATAIASGGPR